MYQGYLFGYLYISKSLDAAVSNHTLITRINTCFLYLNLPSSNVFASDLRRITFPVETGLELYFLDSVYTKYVYLTYRYEYEEKNICYIKKKKL